ncbi:MAG: amino acid synthesis family protein [Hyphomicrobiaceae bacterium]
MPSELKPVIRKIVTHHETTMIEGGKAAEPPLKLFAAAAVIKNPWAGRGFVEDLTPEIYAFGPVMGELLTNEMLALAGSGDRVEGYGKCAIVGMDGEVEHASGLIHTLRFGNTYRKAVGAESYLSFANTRGGPNAPIVIPLMHKHDAGMRSHYLTIQFAIPDAPAADEVVIALGGSIGGRPHHRIGDRYKDLEQLGSTNA